MNGKSIKQAYIDNCTFVKTILMLCVIIGHCANFWNGAWFTLIIPRYSSNIIAVISVWLNSFHIYAFTLVSGYLYYFLKYEKNKYHEVVPFVLIKVKRLLIPYCFCAFIWVVPITAYLYSFSLKDIFEKYDITHVILYKNSKMNMIIQDGNLDGYKLLKEDDKFVFYDITNKF